MRRMINLYQHNVYMQQSGNPDRQPIVCFRYINSKSTPATMMDVRDYLVKHGAVCEEPTPGYYWPSRTQFCNIDGWTQTDPDNHFISGCIYAEDEDCCPEMPFSVAGVAEIDGGTDTINFGADELVRFEDFVYPLN